MANHKIQLKDNAGNLLFPNVKRATMDDFAHTHNYDKATGVKINSITPAGTVTLSRSANVALSTVTINQITGVGSVPTSEVKTVVTSAVGSVSATFAGTVNAGSNTTSAGGTKYLEDASLSGGSVSPTTSYMHWSAGSVPTRAAVSVVTGVSGGGGSRTLSYLHYTAPTATKGSYTPAGTINRSASVALSNNTGLCKATVSGTTLNLASADVGVSTQPAFTFAGTATNALVTAVSGGSLTANSTSSGGIKFTSDASFSNASGSTAQIYQITGVGSNPSLTFNGTASGGQAFVTAVGHTSPTLNKTTKYLHPSVSGTVSVSTSAAPTTTVSSIKTVGSVPTMSTVTVATGVSTQPNFTGTFKGTAVTPTGTITTSTATTGAVK